MADTETPPPPAGFHLLAEKRPAFSRWNGPLFAEANRPSGSRRAFFAGPRHSDDGATVARAMVLAFLDEVMAHSVTRGAGMFGVTVELTLTLGDPAPVDQWVFAEARMIGSDAKLAFVEGRVVAGGRELARGSGVFKLMRPPHRGGRRFG